MTDVCHVCGLTVHDTMTGPFGVKETSTKRLTESTKIETDTGELVSQVLKTIQDRPLKAHFVDLVRLKITLKARDNLVKTLESEKKSARSCSRVC